MQATRDTRRADNRYGLLGEMGVAQMAGHAQSSRAANSGHSNRSYGTTGDGLEGSAGKLTEP